MTVENVAAEVTVVVPAYNASATINETLLSVRMQTHTNLEIIVVDDGSKDNTCEIVERHIAADSRIRLLKQANGGVARARNAGMAVASGEFFAPIDADDLWWPDKIARQLELMRHLAPSVNLVYSWYASIDSESRIQEIVKPTEEGQVLAALCITNFLGHASSPLIRTHDLIRVGGYDPSLRDQKAQGCEDWDVYFKLAEIGEFAVIKSPLTGYRDTPQAMSQDIGQMLRSGNIVLSRFQRLHPEYKAQFHIGKQRITLHFLKKALLASRYQSALATFGKIFVADPRFGFELLRLLRLTKVRRAYERVRGVGSVSGRPHFLAACLSDGGEIDGAAG